MCSIAYWRAVSGIWGRGRGFSWFWEAQVFRYLCRPTVTESPYRTIVLITRKWCDVSRGFRRALYQTLPYHSAVMFRGVSEGHSIGPTDNGSRIFRRRIVHRKKKKRKKTKPNLTNLIWPNRNYGELRIKSLRTIVPWCSRGFKRALKKSYTKKYYAEKSCTRNLWRKMRARPIAPPPLGFAPVDSPPKLI